MQEYIKFSRNPKLHRFIADLVEIASVMLCMIFAVLFVFSYLFNVVTVQGTSMVSTLQEKDMLIVSLLDRNLCCGDIIVIDNVSATLLDEQQQPYTADGLNKCIVKRVIGVGGQELNINFADSTVSVDGTVIDEPYTNGLTNGPLAGGAFTYPIFIPEGYLFVMGDNREISKDSRYPDIGLVPESAVRGKVVLRAYPYNSFGWIE